MKRERKEKNNVLQKMGGRRDKYDAPSSDIVINESRSRNQISGGMVNEK